ncbi:MAG: FHA domain-containing protein [Porphyromonadaceae bacterium]|nr:FHA domain-containing protein [Porphyromonadaceae bacterium]
MKRVLCPRCDGYVTFNEQRCDEGMAIYLVCPHCGKNFSLLYEEIFMHPDVPDYGTLVVLENNCCERQEYPLSWGENVIGRRNKGTDVDIAIESSDADLERRHCIIQVGSNRNGEIVYTLRDCSARAGTYFRQNRLGKHEQVRLDDGDVVSIGGTTFILYLPAHDEEDK